MNQPPDEQVQAGIIAGKAIALGRELCKTEVDGRLLDNEIEQFIRDNGGSPALKGYKPPFDSKTYGHSICLSVNNEAVHGTPIKIVTPVDLVTIDLVVNYNGWFADTARTFSYSTDQEIKSAVIKSETIFAASLAAITPNRTISLFGATVELSSEMMGCSVVKEYCGHGIGQGIHMEPQIVNYNDYSVVNFEIGRSYAVEPVLAMKSNYRLEHLEDGWTVSTNCLSTHNEDTVFISNKGVVNLTSNHGRE